MSLLDKKTFPYLAPNKDIYSRYGYIFKLKIPIKKRKFKRFIDIFFSLNFLFMTFPFILFFISIYLIEMLFVKSSRGYLFYYYFSMSAGKKFKKYKIRTIKKSYIDKNLDSIHKWGAHKAEWNNEALTYTGKFIKLFYLDEVPQFYNILKGDISLIGPRALSEEHYMADIKQGNNYRKVITAGLIGLGHANKGTNEMGNPKYEYEYLDSYINNSFYQFYFLEIKIIYKSILLVLKGGGH